MPVTTESDGFADLQPRTLKRRLRDRVRTMEGYSAFISHAHDPDGPIARRVEQKLETWARPVFGGRTMRVFRDVSKMSASPGLRSAITAALDASEWLLVFLSPGAVRSPWVNDEIASWKEHKPPEHILLVHSGGHLAWDEKRQDFSMDSDCVPPALLGIFDEIPRYVDFSHLDDYKWWIQRRKFHEGIRDLATRIHGVPADALEGAHRSTVRATRAGLFGLILFLAAAIGFSVVAQRQTTRAGEEAARADEEEAIARANAAASRAFDLYAGDVDTGLLLAVEAWSHRDTPETRAALAAGLVEHRHLEQVLRFTEAPHRIAVSPDERLLAVATLDQMLHVDDLDNRSGPESVFVPMLVEQMAFDSENTRLALVSPDFDPTMPNLLEVRSVSDLASVMTSAQLEAAPLAITFAGSSTLVAFRDGIDMIGPDGEARRILEIPVNAVATDREGRRMAVATENETENLLQLYDIASGMANGELEAVVEAPITAVGMNVEGTMAAFATSRGVGMWDIENGFVLTSPQNISDVSRVTPTDDGGGVVALRQNGEVVIWHPFAADVTSISVSGKATGVPPATGSRGLRVASAGDRLVSVWRTDRPFQNATRVASFGDGVRHIDFSPDGSLLLAADLSGISIWTVSDWTMIDRIEGDFCTASFTAGGDSIWSIEPSDAGSAEIRRRSIAELAQFESHGTAQLKECGFNSDISRDGTRYAEDGTVYGITEGQTVTGDVSSIDTALSDDGTRLAWTSSGSDLSGPVIRVLDVDSAVEYQAETLGVTEIRTGQTLWGIGLGPDGLLATGVVSGEDEGAIALWDGDFNLILSLPRPHSGSREPAGENPVTALAISADGTLLATGGLIGSLVVWEIGPEALVDHACAIAGRTIREAELEGSFSPGVLGFEPRNVCAGVERAGISTLP